MITELFMKGMRRNRNSGEAEHTTIRFYTTTDRIRRALPRLMKAKFFKEWEYKEPFIFSPFDTNNLTKELTSKETEMISIEKCGIIRWDVKSTNIKYNEQENGEFISKIFF